MTYRILSLDGGGAWALIETRALIELYGKSARGRDILAEFDLVAANSGGSLVLGGLVENLTLGELLTYFDDETKRRSIFSPGGSWFYRLLNSQLGIGPIYSAQNKLPALQKLLPTYGDKPLGDSVKGLRRAGAAEDVRLVIVGFDCDRNRANFFRSAASSGPHLGRGNATTFTLAQAIHASSNAPVNYFDGPAIVPAPGRFPDNLCRFWDGGMTGFNNPVLAAVTEALVAKQKPADIVALSLGTGTVALPAPTAADPPASRYVRPAQQRGLFADVRKVATCILDDPPDSATFLAHVMTGGAIAEGLPDGVSSRVVRLNPLVSPLGKPGAWQPPNMTPDEFTYLVKLDMDGVEREQVRAISRLADLWIADCTANQPIRMDSDTLACELGHPRFSDAIKAWKTLHSL